MEDKNSFYFIYIDHQAIKIADLIQQYTVQLSALAHIKDAERLEYHAATKSLLIWTAQSILHRVTLNACNDINYIHKNAANECVPLPCYRNGICGENEVFEDKKCKCVLGYHNENTEVCFLAPLQI